ncbi:MAG TPA: hypothetical protein VM842_01355, partial [Nitrospira sp.]|nr:hypothetical protein [Nitrospira sp.]
NQAGLAHVYDYVASLFIVNDVIRPETWLELREDLAGLLDSSGDDLLGGVTEPPIPGLIVKLATRSAEGLAAAEAALWHAVRLRLFGLPRPELRRY